MQYYEDELLRFQEFLAGAHLSLQANFAQQAAQLAGAEAKWREVILLAKDALITPGGRTPSFSGYPIYCAVLDEGLRELDDIKDYIEAHGVSL